MTDANMTLNEGVAAVLRGLMAVKQVTQADVASSAAVSQSQFSKMLRGRRPISLDQLAAICAHLSADPAQIVAQGLTYTRLP